MIVCLCKRISSRVIEDYAHRGLILSAVQADHGLGSNCGQCLELAKAMVERSQGTPHSLRLIDDSAQVLTLEGARG